MLRSLPAAVASALLPLAICALGGALGGGVLPAAADDVAPHVVSVKNIDPNHLITVQIDPVEQEKYMSENGWTATDAATAKPTVLPPVDGNAQQAALHSGGGATGSNAIVRFAPNKPGLPAYDWYWKLVPAGLNDGIGRFQTALAALDQGPAGASVDAPRLQAMQDLASTWGTDILTDTVGTEVSPALVLAVMAVESGGDASALSPVGAQGLMQLIPATAKRFGVSDPMDGAQSIRGAVAYLDALMHRFNSDPVLVLAAYNAGAGAVRDHSGVPTYRETRDYVPKVLAAWQVAKGLCLTPPLLVSDPCVFRVLSAQK